MYLMYVDESGDPGNNIAQSPFFCLSGLIFHETNWHEFIKRSKEFRRRLKDNYGFPVRSEIHAADLLRHNKFDIAKHRRLAIMRNYLDELSQMDFISITNVVVDKSTKLHDYDIFGNAWKTLFQRFENTLKYGNFPGCFRSSYGTVYTDATNGEELSKIMRKMSVYNPIPSSVGGPVRDLPILKVIEDPSSRNSEHSLPIQACDVIAYFLHQSLRPNAYIRKSGAQNYFKRLDAVLNKKASKTNPLGVVTI